MRGDDYPERHHHRNPHLHKLHLRAAVVGTCLYAENPQDVQDARISLARLAEVQLKEDENTAAIPELRLRTA